RHTASTSATAGRATANSAAAPPVSSAAEGERIAHEVGEDLLHLGRTQDHDEQPGEADGRHDRDRVLGGGGAVVAAGAAGQAAGDASHGVPLLSAARRVHARAAGATVGGHSTIRGEPAGAAPGEGASEGGDRSP